MRRLNPFFLLLILLSAYCATAQSSPVRIGIIGDSITDEYQSPGEAWDGARNWLEHLVLSNRVDAGAWQMNGEPRRTGYTQNWARYGATTESAISAGQHTGLAGQGVDLAVIWIGSNDYAYYSGASSAYGLIYNSVIDDSGLAAKEAQIISRITTMLAAVKTGNTRAVLVTINDWGNSLAVIAQFPNATKRARVTASVNRVNAQISALATAQGAALFDLAAFYASMPINQNGTLTVGGYVVNIFAACNAPNCGIVGDGIHTNSVPSGLIANGILAAYNTYYEPDILPLSDNEILVNAGVLSATATPSPTATFTPEPTYTNTSTLMPPSTVTPIPTETPTETPSNTFTPIPTDTPTETATSTPSATETPIPTDTATHTPTATETETPTSTDTPAPTLTYTETATSIPTGTDTPMATQTIIPTETSTPTVTFTSIPTQTPSLTVTAVPLVMTLETDLGIPLVIPFNAFAASFGSEPDLVGRADYGAVYLLQESLVFYPARAGLDTFTVILEDERTATIEITVT